MKEITIYNDYSPSFTFNQEQIKKLVLNILSKKKLINIKLSIIFTNRKFLSEMKKKYFNVNQYTDVIAFNLEDSSNCLDGEIYISIADVKENAKLFSQSFSQEFKRVIIHGSLHLIGYNDSTKEEVTLMRSLEDEYLLKTKSISII